MDNTRTTLMDLELKIHDARRQIEKLLDIDRAGIALPDRELEALATDLVQSLQHFYNIKNRAEMGINEITQGPKSNVVGFTPRENK